MLVVRVDDPVKDGAKALPPPAVFDPGQDHQHEQNVVQAIKAAFSAISHFV
jgi:hypothetical protein